VPRPSAPRLLTAVALATLGLALPASAGAAAAPAGLAFYTPPAALTGTPGDVVWSRPLTGVPALKAAASNTLVLYRSTAVDGSANAVSGTVSVPKGKAPKGGWPVISWTHATTGIADVCAPSRDAKDSPAHADIDYVYPQLNAWLKKGFAVVRTDYEGLGTPGIHPYLIGASEARSAVDIIRAARQLNAKIGKTWIAAGHSQGGQAALFTAALGPKLAPELRLRGVAAFAPASHIGQLVNLAGSVKTPGGSLSGTGSLFISGAAAGSKDVDLQTLLTPDAYALLPQVEEQCLAQLSEASSWGGLAPANLLSTTADRTALNRVLAENDPSSLTFKVPVLLLQGTSDAAVFESFTKDLYGVLKRKPGTKIAYKTFKGAGHYPLLAAAEKDATAFLLQRTK
jgi:pimeloyl-ACP methyl ester carboxylesterase